MKKCWLNSKVWSDEAMAKNNGLKPWMWSWEEEWMKKTIVAKKKMWKRIAIVGDDRVTFWSVRGNANVMKIRGRKNGRAIRLEWWFGINKKKNGSNWQMREWSWFSLMLLFSIWWYIPEMLSSKIRLLILLFGCAGRAYLPEEHDIGDRIFPK